MYLFKEPVGDKGDTVVWESSPEKCKGDKQNELGGGGGFNTHVDIGGGGGKGGVNTHVVGKYLNLNEGGPSELFCSMAKH